MKISWIKQENDNKNFAIAERLGLGVYRLSNPEEVDKKMEDLIKNQNCRNHQRRFGYQRSYLERQR